MNMQSGMGNMVGCLLVLAIVANGASVASAEERDVVEVVNNATSISQSVSRSQVVEKDSLREAPQISLPNASENSVEMVDPEFGRLTISGPEGKVVHKGEAVVIERDGTHVIQQVSENSVQYASILEKGDSVKQTYTISADADFSLEETSSGDVDIVLNGGWGKAWT